MNKQFTTSALLLFLILIVSSNLTYAGDGSPIFGFLIIGLTGSLTILGIIACLVIMIKEFFSLGDFYDGSEYTDNSTSTNHSTLSKLVLILGALIFITPLVIFVYSFFHSRVKLNQTVFWMAIYSIFIGPIVMFIGLYLKKREDI